MTKKDMYAFLIMVSVFLASAEIDSVKLLLLWELGCMALLTFSVCKYRKGNE